MDLAQIQAHPSFPFHGFLENDLEFLLLELFWVETFRACFNNAEQLADWQPLVPAERDGAPILVMGNTRIRRAITVQMRTNEEQKPMYQPGEPDAFEKYFLPFDLWRKETIDPYTNTRFSGLIVSTDMSPRAIELAKEVTTRFCVDQEPEREIDKWIAAYYDELAKRGFEPARSQ